MKKPFIQLHLAVLLAGLTGILGRLISLNEGLLVWYRLLITSVALWILYLLRPEKSALGSKAIWKLFLVGTIAALHWVSFYGSIKTANISIALVCFSAIGFFTAVMEPVIFRTRFNFSELLLGLMVIVGIFFIFHFDPKYKLGIIIGLFSAWVGSIFPILNGRLLQTIPVEAATRYELSGGFLFLSIAMPFYLWLFPTRHLFPDPADWLWLMILGLLCTVLAFNLSMSALKKISAFTVNLTYNLEPLYGIALAFAIFHENKYLNSGFYIGFSLILLAIAIQMFKIVRNSENLQNRVDP
jgi:drug/metabolite transporter (DMT)-like permease